MAVTHGNAGGDETLVATPPTGFTVGSKGITAGANIELTSDADSVTVTGENATSDSPVCNIYRNANVSVVNSSLTTVTFTTALFDPYAMWDSGATSQRIYITEPGLYEIYSWGRWLGHASSNGFVRSDLNFYNDSGANNITVSLSYETLVGATYVTTQNYIQRELDVDDYVYMNVLNSTGQTVTLETVANGPLLGVKKIRSS